MRFPDREFWVKIDPKLPFWGRNREKSGNFQKIGKETMQTCFIIKIHILAMFYDKIMIFDKIRRHLVILPFTVLRP